MGKKLDALLGRSFRPAKFKALVNLAISRQAVLKKQHNSRFSMARSDVIQILNLHHHERALLRVEQVIKEQSIMDVLVMIETYCHLLIERINLLEHAKECPEELKEAISSIIYAATRCGEFPELRELRDVFTLRFGKEFVANAVELRNYCGVNPKMIQKLSTRMPSIENREKVLKEIALENNIVFQVPEDVGITTIVTEDVGKTGGFSNSMQTRRKYKDVADAAMAAFESAAYAAEAARAAVELSRGDSHQFDDPKNIEDLNIRNQTNYYSESGDNKMNNDTKYIERSLSTSSLESADNGNDDEIVNVTRISLSSSHVKDSGEILSSEKIDTVKDDVAEDGKIRTNFSSEKEFLLKSEERTKKTEDDSQIDKTPASVRTRRTYRR